MSAVVDTDVVSFVFKNDTRAGFYQAQLLGLSPMLSFMTVAELDAWGLRRRWGPAKLARLEQIISHFTVINPDRDLCRRWAEVTDAGRRAGRPIQAADAWIAATALHFGVPLLTHNRSNFAAVPGFTLVSAVP
jgi:predicted nucleic acid-binding protein